ncbi:kinesin-domain-containing protein [Panus rudis PR-1116 ss-1]|nr:kinesin-domain-containing protein [Panus rudis PR-1116 ss-1]
MGPPPSTTSTRPKSALAKTGSSQRPNLATPSEDGSETGPSNHKLHTSQEKSGEPGSNIQVVIRCRRRSEREIQDNSPIIVNTNGAKSQGVTIETAAPVSSLGMVSLPPTRTYPFDMVFGPEADQAMIYYDVVSPMLEEVLQGYNCTLFAYGQTGTGKTYTMQGDLNPTPMGNPSASAGMIPRVLFKLFHQLESSGLDYSVKISFVELYNEELRDLLAPELSAPIGTAQPMGKGAGQSEGQGALKIFDDSSKKGVFIQGLEEAPVTSTAEALALLQKGSHRRQIAATKFNDHSSRSHSVFSITIHTKETSTMGDDLLRVGKLNLVDLAGSENIGRSGAENKRAREAGMINQSLLTLGRVINALVDRSSHVPYRESKLTRLLQDSLGGRTKTCIIATISPARSNMEETLSTLDYAIRAKSIRNKPEVNQRMSRNALLKEYIGEIERLKADLLAAREKNGIFFSEESWNQMTAEQELKETEMQEAKKQVEIVENQLRNVREEFEQSIALLLKRDGELRETKAKLIETESELVEKEGQLRVVKGALEEEVVVRKAYQETEVALDSVATGLKQVAHQTVDDLGRLFGKLERKTTVFHHNTKAVSTHTRNLGTEALNATSQLDEFAKSCKQHFTQLKTEAEQFKNKELSTLTNVSSRISEQVEKIREALKIVQAKDQASDEALMSIQSAVEETQESIRSSFNTWAEELIQHTEITCKQVEASHAASCTAVEKAFKSLGSLAQNVLQEAQSYIATERKSLLEAKSLADNTSKAEITRLRQQNDLLTRLLESEKVKAERAKDDLLNQISSLLSEFTSERDRSLRDTFSEMTESNSIAEKGMVALGSQQGQKLDKIVEDGRKWGTSLEKTSVDARKAQDAGSKALDKLFSNTRDGFSDIQKTVSSSTTTYTNDLKRRLHVLHASYTEANDRLNGVKRARVDATKSIASEAQFGFNFVQRAAASTSRNIDMMSSRVSTEMSDLTNSLDAYRSAAANHLSSIRQTTQILAEQGAKEDVPTGTTPKKREWDFADRWELTKSRDVILKDWRRNRSPSEPGSETFLAEHVPLPSGEQTADEASDSESQGGVEDDTIRIASPAASIHSEASAASPLSLKSSAASLSSSASSSSVPTPLSLSVSSTSSIPPPVPQSKILKPRKPLKSELPTYSTLTERSTNVVGTRGLKRTRR